VERARQFQAEHGGQTVYADYHQMLAKEHLDIVSICTWPHLHAEMTIAVAQAGVRAIHCEKPMATTYADAVRMARICRERGVQLTFNHQRRFGEPFTKARDLLLSGAIGKLLRMEAVCGDLYDWGTHWFNMLCYYNGDTPVDWVLGQVDLRGHHKVFGVELEGQGLSHFKFRNDVRGLLITGHEARYGCDNRLIGTEGTIEVGVGGDVHLRTWHRGQTDWQVIPTSEDVHADAAHGRGIRDVVEALKTGREPVLGARQTLQSTELIFATYESSRRRGRVDLPLTIEDSPLDAMLAERTL
jgi:UDP-N-acetylglucosamine 3-dehydrogenase